MRRLDPMGAQDTARGRDRLGLSSLDRPPDAVAAGVRESTPRRSHPEYISQLELILLILESFDAKVEP
jgi:hypothetical protein